MFQERAAFESSMLDLFFFFLFVGTCHFGGVK